jgi:hypothetical protein
MYYLQIQKIKVLLNSSGDLHGCRQEENLNWFPSRLMYKRAFPERGRGRGRISWWTLSMAFLNQNLPKRVRLHGRNQSRKERVRYVQYSAALCHAKDIFSMDHIIIIIIYSACRRLREERNTAKRGGYKHTTVISG